MRKHTSTRPQRHISVPTLFFAFLAITGLSQAQVGFKLPDAKIILVPLAGTGTANPISMATPFGYDGPSFPSSFRYSVEMDSSRQNYTISRKYQNRDIFLPRQYSFSDFIRERLDFGTSAQWQKFASSNVAPSSGFGRGKGGITLESGKIKSEAFKKLFGGETVSLNINGSISIDGTLRNEKRSSKRTASNRRPNTNFQMKQKQRFSVTGKIGENITVDVEQDSENDFEFENAVKLSYSSDEDGIVKSIEAGNISLNLPGTNFVTFSQQNAGLFGLKANFQVGRLGITAIASMEKGKKNTLAIDAEGKTNTYVIEDYQYKKGSYFFLDNEYRVLYKQYKNGMHQSEPTLFIEEIEVYKSDVGYTQAMGEDMLRAWAIPDPSTVGTDTLAANNNEIKRAYFKKLKPVQDYYINRDLGYIQMSMSLQESEVLAVIYKTTTAIHGSGIKPFTDPEPMPVLKLIKAQNPDPGFKTWDLEWKNVYDLRVPNITNEEFAENLEVKIFFKNPSGLPKESIDINGQPTSYLNLLGLDNTGMSGSSLPDNKIDNNPNIINKVRGEIMLPNLRPFDPDTLNGDYSEDYWDAAGKDKRNAAIYDSTRSGVNLRELKGQSKFYFEVTSSRRQTTYNLGMNIIEGTEEIILSGRKLLRDVDYKIEYYSGSLELTTPDASDPSAEITINYESQQMFSSSKKLMIGTRAQYSLWEQNGRESFIGGTFLYLDKSLMDKRIRLDKEAPMRNMVWDINTKITRESNSFTNWLNKKIGFLNLSGASRLGFEAEIAQIIPNPNTLNNKATGDRNGVAYLDDFEGAKRKVPMGVMRRNWRHGSLPVTQNSLSQTLENMGHLVWYNPWVKTAIQEIWPEKEVTNSNGGTSVTDVLILDYEPNPDSGKDSWSAIMRGLSPGYYNQVDARFLEVWVKPNTTGLFTYGDDTTANVYSDQPTLYVDLGQISEDVIPNGTWNTEDAIPSNGYRDNILLDHEDTGIDGMKGDDPESIFATHIACSTETEIIDNYKVITGKPYDFMDLNNDGVKQEDEPYSYDDYYYDDKKPYLTRTDKDGNYRGTRNGTENNGNAGQARYPDSEDLNGNSEVDKRNNFVRYEIDLDSTGTSWDKHLVSTAKSGWRLYRIPLSEFYENEGSPDWSRIENVRMTITGASDRCSIEIAEVELVANEWKYYGVLAEADTTVRAPTAEQDKDKLKLAVVNSHDNPGYKETISAEKMGISGSRDPILKTMSREQSLAMRMQDVQPGETVLARKELNDQNLIQYEKLKMFVHGGGLNTPWNMADSIEFFLRFGSDTDNQIYYEVTLPYVSNGWFDNTIEVDLKELSLLKNNFKGDPFEETVRDTVGNVVYGVKGLPTLRNIRWLIAGVRNKSMDLAFSGEIWLDELRLSNIHKEKGMAKRAKLDIQIADLFSFTGQYDSKDADFHTINEQSTGQGSDSENWLINGSMNLDKLMPSRWGIRIPISYKKSQSTRTPKYIPGSDILVDRDNPPDSLQTTNTSESLSLRYSKTTKSRNLLGKILFDPFSFSANHSTQDRTDPRTGESSRTSNSGKFAYHLNIGDKIFFKPFSWLGEKGFMKKIAGIKFFAPSSFNFDADATDNLTEKTSAGGVQGNIGKAILNRRITAKWKPFSIMQLDYSLTDNYDLLADTSAQDTSVQAASPEIRAVQISEFLNILNPNGIHVGQKQSISTSLTPKIAKWFKPTIRYKTDYSYAFNPQQHHTGTARSAKVSTNLSGNVTLTPKELVALFKSKKKGPGGNRTAARRGRRAPVKRKTPGESDKKEEEKKPGKSPITFVFSTIGSVFGSINPIVISYTERNTDSQYGLEEDPDLLYQMGWSRDAGPLSDNLTSDRASWNTAQTISLRSGFKIKRSITASLNYSMTENTTQQSINTKKTSNSALVMGEGKNTLPFPTWSVTWNGLEKLPLMNLFLKTMTLKHGYNGKWDKTFKSGEHIQNQYSMSFQPLIGGTINFKFGMTATFDYKLGESITQELKTGSSVVRQSTEDMSFTTRYQKRGGIKLPFFKKKLDNNIDFSMTFRKSRNMRDKKLSEDADYQVISETSNWSIKPQVDYSFTKNVRGGFHLEYGKRKSSKTEKQRTFALGINAVINLSGR
ncbi:cell surface protein SprA [bacterium]|nr:cell surface protein SprA [bacterium]